MTARPAVNARIGGVSIVVLLVQRDRPHCALFRSPFRGKVERRSSAVQIRPPRPHLPIIEARARRAPLGPSPTVRRAPTAVARPAPTAAPAPLPARSAEWDRGAE